MYFVVFVAAFAAVAVNGQTRICPGVKPMSNLDISKYRGTWHIIAYATCTVAMPNVKCQTRHITAKDDDSATLKTTATDSKTDDSISSDETLTVDKHSAAKYYLKNGSETHVVFDTDYENYSVVLVYLTVNGIKGSILMVTSRKKEITDDDIKKKYKHAVDKAGFDPDDLKQMHQTGCSKN